MKVQIAIGFVFGVGASTVAACVVSKAYPDHCANQDGDAYCARKYVDGSKRFCSLGVCSTGNRDGCVEARDPSDACYSPCGGDKSLEEDAECEGQAEASSSGSMGTADVTGETAAPTSEPTVGSMSASGSETDGTGGTTEDGCTLSLECLDPGSPICVDAACVPCASDEECLAKSAGAPACGEDGRCVACTPTNASACGGTTPVCDAAVNECVGCEFHEQCVGTACDIATGACFSGDCVVEVDGDDAGADYESIQDAIMDGCVVLVHDAAGGYPEEVSIEGDVRVAILAADGTSPILGGALGSGQPALEVSGGATAYVQRLRINGNDMGGLGVSVDGAAVYLDQTEMVGNGGGGILLTGGATGQLRNCFVEGDSDIVAMTVDGSAADILYTTLGGQFDAPALLCTDPMEVTVRNSIMVSRAVTSDLECDDASISFTATEFMVPGEGNVALGEMNMADATAWFDGYNTGDFGLSNPPADVLSTAQWRTGDPLVDMDGDARVAVDGEMEAAGADAP